MAAYRTAHRLFRPVAHCPPLIKLALAWHSLQAMAAYRTAHRLFPGLHAPLMGMGQEYQRMNNLGLAEQCFSQVGLTFLLCTTFAGQWGGHQCAKRP